MTERTVHVASSWAPLLSGGLSGCFTANDPTCQGGVAAAAAFSRFHSNGEPMLFVSWADRDSPFVQMHPLGWSVNRLVLKDMLDLDVLISPPALLTQNKGDFEISQRDISDLQTEDMPLLLTNVVIPPGNSWYHFHKTVHLDEDTGLAAIMVIGFDFIFSSSQIESVQGTLRYIAKLNAEAGCTDSKSLYQEYATRNATSSEDVRCWIPIVTFFNAKEKFLEFVSVMTEFEHPPAVIMGIEAQDPTYSTPRQVGTKGVWVLSYEMDRTTYLQHSFTLSPDGLSITAISMIRENLLTLPAEAKDDTYTSHIQYLRQLANEAFQNNPIVGQSGFMPVARSDSPSYRRCHAGECEIGNLFTDALLWRADAEFAFITSGGIRGQGWQAGDVRVLNLWDALPYPNILCTGTMSGLSLFKLLDYSVRTATFQGQDTVNGGELLQVSGMKVTYNTEIPGSRLIAIEIWDKSDKKYLPIERLRLYRFATDSFLCGGHAPFTDLVGGDFTIEGEKPGIIGEDLHQSIVADYLSQLDNPYETSIQGRLLNDTSSREVMNLVQTEESCRANTFWVEEQRTCAECSLGEHVAFSDETLHFEMEGTTSDSRQKGRIILVNRELFSVTAVPKSVPSWVDFTGISLSEMEVNREPMTLLSGESVALEFLIGSSGLEVGTALGTVSFGVLDSENSQSCVGHDATFDIFLRVTPDEELNQLGSIRAVGLSLMAIAVALALCYAVWVYLNKTKKMVKTMQPIFLVTICIGVGVMALGIVPLSIDDGIASTRGCDIACVSVPWLLSLGFTIAFSALFSKLWRINKLFHNPSFRRVKVTEKDVLAPFATLFTLNFAVLLTWTLIDPVYWSRNQVGGEQWNTFGSCKIGGTAGKTSFALIAAFNVGALFLACYQAYKARNISDDFSEGKNVGFAVFSWVQVLMVGIPVLFLIDEDNPTAKYFLQVVLLFVLCISMLSLIFVPIMVQLRRRRMNEPKPDRVIVTGLPLEPAFGAPTTAGLPTNTITDY
jgi:hypothetical protein